MTFSLGWLDLWQLLLNHPVAACSSTTSRPSATGPRADPTGTGLLFIAGMEIFYSPDVF